MMGALVANVYSTLPKDVGSIEWTEHIVPRGGKKYFLCSLNLYIQISGEYIDLLCVFFIKRILHNIYPFWFYVVLNIAFLKEIKVHKENSVIFSRFLKKKKKKKVF